MESSITTILAIAIKVDEKYDDTSIRDSCKEPLVCRGFTRLSLASYSFCFCFSDKLVHPDEKITCGRRNVVAGPTIGIMSPVQRPWRLDLLIVSCCSTSIQDFASSFHATVTAYLSRSPVWMDSSPLCDKRHCNAQQQASRIGES